MIATDCRLRQSSTAWLPTPRAGGAHFTYTPRISMAEHSIQSWPEDGCASVEYRRVTVSPTASGNVSVWAVTDVPEITYPAITPTMSKTIDHRFAMAKPAVSKYRQIGCREPVGPTRADAKTRQSR